MAKKTAPESDVVEKAAPEKGAKKEKKSPGTSKVSAASDTGAGASSEPSDKPGRKAVKKTGTQPPRAKLAEKTFFAKAGQIPQNWRIVDATGIRLGRLSTVVASILMGKDKATYTRSMNMSDNVIVVNCEKVVLTGSKWAKKTYNYHTQFPGGIKTFTAEQIREEHPKRLIEWSVFGMLPKGHMGRTWYKKLWVYAGPEHPHKAQKPLPVPATSFSLQGRN